MIMWRVAHLSHTLQDADLLVESARLHAFQILKQLYECITPEGKRGCWRSIRVDAANLALEGRPESEFSLDLPPPPVGLDPDQQQQLDALRDQFVLKKNYRKRLFLNASKEEAADAIGANRETRYSKLALKKKPDSRNFLNQAALAPPLK